MWRQLEKDKAEAEVQLKAILTEEQIKLFDKLQGKDATTPKTATTPAPDKRRR